MNEFVLKTDRLPVEGRLSNPTSLHSPPTSGSESRNKSGPLTRLQHQRSTTPGPRQLLDPPEHLALNNTQPVHTLLQGQPSEKWLGSLNLEPDERQET